MFIHWGVYSILGDGEWVMNNQGIDKASYQKLPSFFNPVSYNPKEWLLLLSCRHEIHNYYPANITMGLQCGTQSLLTGISSAEPPMAGMLSRC